MKLVRVLCSIGNGLLGLSPPKPSGQTCSLHCQGNLFKGQGDPAHQAPKGTLALLPPPAALSASPHRLDNSHYGSNFSRLHLGEKKKLSLNLIILTGPGVVFVILRLTGRARESRGSEEK